MSATTRLPVKPKSVYPESDGKPMADNTLQFEWIVTITCGLDAVYRDDQNVFVAGDLLWYPVEGQPTICAAPDTLVAFGRPRGHRGSYKQWEEGGIGPQVVFEVLSPNNTQRELTRKFRFYERYGVEEYYLWNPDNGDLSGWLRQGTELVDIENMNGWTSPRLQIRFELVDGDLRIYGPDGKQFATYLELVERQAKELREKEQIQREKEVAQQRAERLAAQLRALGVEPEA